jgi:HK97 gp10 family phage protein
VGFLMPYSQQVRDFERRMEAIPAQLRAELLVILSKNAEELAAAIRQLAESSRDTGALIDSVKVTGPGERTPDYSMGGGQLVGPLEFIVSVGNHAVRYGHLVEYGTVDSEAQPFFWPAVRALQRQFDNRLKREIRAFVKRWSA